jgi:hypothetical protein
MRTLNLLTVSMRATFIRPRYLQRRAEQIVDASGWSVFLNLLGAAEGALIRAAASTSMKPGRVKR